MWIGLDTPKLFELVLQCITVVKYIFFFSLCLVLYLKGENRWREKKNRLTFIEARAPVFWIVGSCV